MEQDKQLLNVGKKTNDRQALNAIKVHIEEVVRPSMRENQNMFKDKKDIICFMDQVEFIKDA